MVKVVVCTTEDSFLQWWVTQSVIFDAAWGSFSVLISTTALL